MGFIGKFIPLRVYLYGIVMLMLVGGIGYMYNSIHNKNMAYEKTISDLNTTVVNENNTIVVLIKDNNILRLTEALATSDADKLKNAIQIRNNDIETLSNTLTKTKLEYKDWLALDTDIKFSRETNSILDQNLSDPSCDQLKTLSKTIGELKYENL